MAKPKDYALYYVCSLIEYIGRERKLKRRDVVNAIGKEKLAHLYELADIYHCEPIAKIVDEVVHERNIPKGNFDNVAAAEYHIPDAWTIGDVYSRLIHDVHNSGDVVDTLIEVYSSAWIDDGISDYNCVFYFQPREYLAESYRAGNFLEGF